MEHTYKPAVGETLWSLNVGNAAHRTEQKLTEHKVIKVGRKYFTTKPTDKDYDYLEVRFYIENWREVSDRSPCHKLYFTPSVYEDEVKSKRLCRKIGDAFEYGKNVRGLCTDDLQRIANIVIGID